MADKAFDVVLFGATGFTGSLVAEYLAKARPDLSWALAGRSMQKLEQVRRSLTQINPGLGALPLLSADAGDEASLAAVAAQARVICTTVGPYGRYGRGLVKACADAGTDYCDITGEPLFVRDMIDAHHEQAKKTGARIANCCGFDSLPSDLGVLMLHDHLQQQGKRLERAQFLLGRSRGGVSGGTAHTMVDLMEIASRDRKARRVMVDPYSLLPDPADRGTDGLDLTPPRWNRDARRWTAPFVMATINAKIVRRSNALLGFPYGRDFHYAEAMTMPLGVAGVIPAVAFSAGLGAFSTLASLAPTRSLLRRLLPASGDGPSKATRDQGGFKIRLLGWAQGDARPSVSGEVEGFADPGYGETAKMLGETALLLADTRREGKTNPGGLLTPASALGMPLVERLRTAGMRFEVRPSPA